MDESKLSKYAAKKLRQAREAAKESKAKAEEPKSKAEEPKAKAEEAKADAPSAPPRQRRPNEKSVRASASAVAAELAKKGNAAVWEDARRDLAEARACVHRVTASMAALLPTASGAFYGEVAGVLGMAHSLEERVQALLERLGAEK